MKTSLVLPNRSFFQPPAPLSKSSFGLWDPPTINFVKQSASSLKLVSLRPHTAAWRQDHGSRSPCQVQPRQEEGSLRSVRRQRTLLSWQAQRALCSLPAARRARHHFQASAGQAATARGVALRPWLHVNAGVGRGERTQEAYIILHRGRTDAGAPPDPSDGNRASPPADGAARTLCVMPPSRCTRSARVAAWSYLVHLRGRAHVSIPLRQLQHAFAAV